MNMFLITVKSYSYVELFEESDVIIQHEIIAVSLYSPGEMLIFTEICLLVGGECLPSILYLYALDHEYFKNQFPDFPPPTDQRYTS